MQLRKEYSQTPQNYSHFRRKRCSAALYGTIGFSCTHWTRIVQKWNCPAPNEYCRSKAVVAIHHDGIHLPYSGFTYRRSNNMQDGSVTVERSKHCPDGWSLRRQIVINQKHTYPC